MRFSSFRVQHRLDSVKRRVSHACMKWQSASWSCIDLVSLFHSTLSGRSNIGLAGCGMGHKIEAGYGICEILRAGYECTHFNWWDVG